MTVEILVGDALERLRELESGSVQACICSPPYLGLRSYLPSGHPDKAKEIGAEATPAEFVAALVEVFSEVRRVLRPDGLLFVNLGDSYAGSGKGPSGHNGVGDQERRQGFTGRNAGFNARWGNSPGAKKQEVVRPIDSRGVVTGVRPKNALLVPERFAIAMQDAGWIVRSRMPWIKANCMPESVTDRPTSAIEWVFMFARQARYYWDAGSVRKANTPLTVARHSGPERRYAIHKPLLTIPPGHPTEAHPDKHHNGLTVNGGGVNGRSFRNSDLFWSHVEAIKAGKGLLTDEDGDPLALLVNPKPLAEAHFAAYPDTLVEPLIRASTREGDTVLDPFAGAGTTLMVADRLGRSAIGVELNPEYARLAQRRIDADAGPLLGETVTVSAPEQLALLPDAPSEAGGHARREAVG